MVIQLSCIDRVRSRRASFRRSRAHLYDNLPTGALAESQVGPQEAKPDEAGGRLDEPAQRSVVGVVGADAGDGDHAASAQATRNANRHGRAATGFGSNGPRSPHRPSAGPATSGRTRVAANTEGAAAQIATRPTPAATNANSRQAALRTCGAASTITGNAIIANAPLTKPMPARRVSTTASRVGTTGCRRSLRARSSPSPPATTETWPARMQPEQHERHRRRNVGVTDAAERRREKDGGGEQRPRQRQGGERSHRRDAGPEGPQLVGELASQRGRQAQLGVGIGFEMIGELGQDPPPKIAADADPEEFGRQQLEIARPGAGPAVHAKTASIVLENSRQRVRRTPSSRSPDRVSA